MTPFCVLKYDEKRVADYESRAYASKTKTRNILVVSQMWKLPPPKIEGKLKLKLNRVVDVV